MRIVSDYINECLNPLKCLRYFKRRLQRSQIFNLTNTNVDTYHNSLEISVPFRSLWGVLLILVLWIMISKLVWKRGRKTWVYNQYLRAKGNNLMCASMRKSKNNCFNGMKLILKTSKKTKCNDYEQMRAIARVHASITTTRCPCYQYTPKFWKGCFWYYIWI